MIKKKVMENLFGQMEINIKACGRKLNKRA